MIHFSAVRWKNFLATGNNFIEIDFMRNHTTILMGESGSGKSTILDAITFALFGRAFRNIKKDQLVNSINEKGCVVEVEFDIGTKYYKVVRGIKPNIFEIYCNGKLLNQDASARDYQKILENNILQFNLKCFTQIVVLGAANFTPFMQLKPVDRRIIIEELLDIEVFSVMNTILKERISKTKDDIREKRYAIDLLEEKIQVHENMVKELARDKNKQIQENEDKIIKNQDQIDKLQLKRTEVDDKITALLETISDRDMIDEQTKKLLDLEKQIEKNIKRTDKERKFFHDHSECPTCNQDIDEEFRKCEHDKREEHLKDLRSGLTDIEDKLQKLNERKEAINKVRDEIEKLEKIRSEHDSSISSIEKYIKKVSREVAELRKPKENISEERQKIKAMKGEKKEEENNRKELIESQHIFDIASELLKDGGIKARIIKQYLPLINKYVNTFLREMNFFVHFDMDEEFNENIKSRGRDPLPYESFSEGEKQRIDLALLFTWRAIARMKNSINTNLLIMDEVFDSYLDNQATENVIRLLNSDLFKKTNIFVISHKETISDKFQGKIRFKKEKNFSRVVD